MKTMSSATARCHPAFDGGRDSMRSRSSTHQGTCCGRELFSEVLDLATGVGILVYTLAPFALPALALVAVTGVLLLIPLFAGAILAAPILLRRHWRRSHARASRARQLAPPERKVRRPRVSTLGATGDPTEILGEVSASQNAGHS